MPSATASCLCHHVAAATGCTWCTQPRLRRAHAERKKQINGRGRFTKHEPTRRKSAVRAHCSATPRSQLVPCSETAAAARAYRMCKTNSWWRLACNDVDEKRGGSWMRNRQVYGLDAQRPVLATEIAAYPRQLLRNRNCGVVTQTTNSYRASEYLKHLQALQNLGVTIVS